MGEGLRCSLAFYKGLHVLLENVYSWLVGSSLHPVLTGGSLLGIVRHARLIPWDDDIDIFMLEGEERSFLELVRNHMPKHLGVTASWCGYRIYHKKTARIHDYFLKSDVGYPFVDVLFLVKRGSVYCPPTKCVRESEKFKREYFFEEELESFQYLAIGKHKYRVPGIYSRYLTRNYGDWKEYPGTAYSHEFSKYFPLNVAQYMDHFTIDVGGNDFHQRREIT